MHALIHIVVALFILTIGGNVACRLMFEWANLTTKSAKTEENAQPAGWLIGWLERLILAIGIIVSSWEVLAAVIALKTVSRFKELDKQDFAEYFLVGSLFSVLWAVVTTSTWLIYDNYMETGIRKFFIEMLVMTAK